METRVQTEVVRHVRHRAGLPFKAWCHMGTYVCACKRANGYASAEYITSATSKETREYELIQLGQSFILDLLPVVLVYPS